MLVNPASRLHFEILLQRLSSRLTSPASVLGVRQATAKLKFRTRSTPPFSPRTFSSTPQTQLGVYVSHTFIQAQHGHVKSHSPTLAQFTHLGNRTRDLPFTLTQLHVGTWGSVQVGAVFGERSGPTVRSVCLCGSTLGCDLFTFPDFSGLFHRRTFIFIQ